MRNGQQKRMRGRNNRRSSNPATRVYESNGPDGKVRGTAHHITEKYQQLARDAQASGDHVAAENFFQHAEHYLRLIASLQGQYAPQAGFGRADDEMDEDDMDDVGGLDAPQPFMREPYAQREPRQGRDDRQPRDDRQSRDDRPYREERQFVMTVRSATTVHRATTGSRARSASSATTARSAMTVPSGTTVSRGTTARRVTIVRP